MKRVALIAGILILATFVGAVGAWLLSPAFVPGLVAGALEKNGLDDVVVDMDRPGLQGVRIARLRAYSPETGIRIAIEGAFVAYRIADLLRGHTNAVTIADARVEVDSNREPAAPLALPPLPMRPLNASWFDYMPTRGVTVARVVVARTDTAAAFPVFSMGLARAGDSAILRARTEGGLGREFELVVDRSGRVGGALAYEDAAREPALEFGITVAGGDAPAWRIRAVSSVAEIKDWFAPIYPLDVPISRCAAVIELSLKENPLEALTMETRLQDCEIAGARFDSASVTGRFMRTTRGFASVVPARIAAQTIDIDGSLNARSVVVHSGIDVDLSNTSLNIPVGATIDAAEVVFGDGYIPRVNAAVAESISFTARDPVPALAFRLDEGELHWSDARVNFGEARVRMPVVSARTTQFDLAFAMLDVDWTGYGAAVNNASAKLTLNEGALRGTLGGKLSGSVPLSGTVRADLASGAGDLALLANGIELGVAPKRASQLVRGWPAGFDLVTGRMDLSVDARWNVEAATVKANVTLDDVGGVFEQAYFSDASMAMSLDVYPALRGGPATLTIGLLDYGVSLSAASAEVSVSTTAGGDIAVSATGVGAGVFGGRVGVPRIDTADTGVIEISLDSIDLSILAGQDRFPGLSMEGRVGGTVPVEIRPEGIYVSGGRLENQGDGAIHYDPGGGGAGSGAEILFKALKNFRYTVLWAEPEYRPDGTLTLAVHMEGTSDEIGRNQPIHFNINVEQNVLSLFESIRLVNGLNDRIDQGVQEFYEKRGSQPPAHSEDKT